MTHVFVRFMPVSWSSAFLSGGKAPACWCRAVTQMIERLTAVRRVGTWIDELCTVHPKLGEGPLFGATLTALTSLTNPEQETQPAIIQGAKVCSTREEKPVSCIRSKTTSNSSARPLFQPEGSNRWRSAAKRKLLEESSANHSAKALSLLNAQADHSLLSRLAGSNVAFERTDQAHAQSFPDKGERNIKSQRTELAQPRPFSVEGKNREAPFPSVDEALEAQQCWMNRLAQRVGKTLNLKQSDAKGTGTVKATQNDAQRSGQLPTLLEQWAMTLDGTLAPLNLLDKLVQEDFPSDEGSSGADPRRVSHSQPPFVSAKQYRPASVEKVAESTQRLENWDGWNNGLASDDNKIEARATPTVTARADSAFFIPDFDKNDPARYGVHEPKPSVPIIPPKLTPSLPDLLPPQRAGAQPLPVAASTVRRGSHEEGISTMDDLDILAVKIKQVLDEQARRHGIDV